MTVRDVVETSLQRRQAKAGGHSQHGGGHAQEADQQQLLAAGLIDQRPRHDGARHVDGADAGAGQSLRLDPRLHSRPLRGSAALKYRACADVRCPHSGSMKCGGLGRATQPLSSRAC